MTRDDKPQRWLEAPDAPEAMKRFLGSFDPEPAPSAEARVWTRLKTRPASSGARLVLIGATALTLAVAILGARSFWLARERIEIGFVDGEVMTATAAAAADPTQVTAGLVLRGGDRVVTGAGRTYVRLGGVAGVVVEAQSDVALSSTRSLALTRGRVVARVQPQTKGRRLSIQADAFEVSVIGTVFRVTHERRDQIDVRVWEGVVEVKGPFGVRQVRGGEAFAYPGPPDATNAVDEQGIVSALERGASLPPRPLPDVGTAGQPPVPATDLRPPVSAEPSSKPSTQKKAANARGSEAEALYQEAAAAVDAKRAVQLFDRVAGQGGPRAELAAYQAARLTAAGDTRAAAGRFDKIVDSHKSAFEIEAWISLIECRLKLGELAAAKRRVQGFLVRHPQNERMPELMFLRAEITRQLDGDCQRSLADYEIAMGAPHRREDALFFKAWCLYQLQQPVAGKEALDQYLRDYPRGRHVTEARQRRDAHP